MITGLDWVLEQRQATVVLEDDMRFGPDLFRFLEQMEARYRQVDTVKMVGGLSLPPYSTRSDLSYSFTRYTLFWGWLTWRRAWRELDEELSDWPERKRDNWLLSFLRDRHAASFYTQLFDNMYNSGGGAFEMPTMGPVNAWSFFWLYSCWKNDGVCIAPSRNLVSNEGFGEGATHVVDENHYLARLPQQPFDTEDVVHPATLDVDNQMDAELFRNWIGYRKLRPSQWLRLALSRIRPLRALYKKLGSREPMGSL